MSSNIKSGTASKSALRLDSSRADPQLPVEFPDVVEKSSPSHKPPLLARGVRRDHRRETARLTTAVAMLKARAL